MGHLETTQMLFYIFPLFLFCAVVFTIYLLAITVREARNVVARQLSEPEKDDMQIRLIPVIGSCQPDQPDEPGKSEQSAEETAELRQQVVEDLRRTYENFTEEMVDRQVALRRSHSLTVRRTSSRRPSNCSSNGSFSFCPTPHSASRSHSEWKLAKDINEVLLFESSRGSVPSVEGNPDL